MCLEDTNIRQRHSQYSCQLAPTNCWAGNSRKYSHYVITLFVLSLTLLFSPQAQQPSFGILQQARKSYILMHGISRQANLPATSSIVREDIGQLSILAMDSQLQDKLKGRLDLSREAGIHTIQTSSTESLIQEPYTNQPVLGLHLLQQSQYQYYNHSSYIQRKDQTSYRILHLPILRTSFGEYPQIQNWHGSNQLVNRQQSRNISSNNISSITQAPIQKLSPKTDGINLYLNHTRTEDHYKP